MEDMMFSCFLFVIIYGFLGWLFSGSTQHQSSSVNDGAWEINGDGEIVVRHEAGAVETVKPIEQQLKDVLWDNVDEVTQTVTEVEQQPTVEELLDGVEVEKITLRKARKIASALGIRQKVNGKDHRKAFLVAQIKKRLALNPSEVAPIIVEKVRAA